MSGVRIYLRGDERLKAIFRNAPLKLTGKLTTTAIDLAMDARDYASEKAGARTGKLRSSITGDVETTDSTLTIRLQTKGVPYARAQEFGADIPPHMILPAAGTALAFFWQGFADVKRGDKAFFAKVMHPGGVIPAKHFIREGLESIRAEFRDECRIALVEATQGEE